MELIRSRLATSATIQPNLINIYCEHSLLRFGLPAVCLRYDGRWMFSGRTLPIIVCHVSRLGMVISRRHIATGSLFPGPLLQRATSHIPFGEGAHNGLNQRSDAADEPCELWARYMKSTANGRTSDNVPLLHATAKQATKYPKPKKNEKPNERA